MRVNGPISVQRSRLLRGQPGGAAHLLVVHAINPAGPPAWTLPPQQRGDAACLTLVMAQTFGAPVPVHGTYDTPAGDDGPIFAIRA